MNIEAILALISDLYMQIIKLQKDNEELRKKIESLKNETNNR